MNHSALITKFILLYAITSVSYAEEQSNKTHISAPLTNTFIVNNYQLNPLLAFHDLTQTNNINNFEPTAQIQGTYTTKIMSIETGLMKPKKAASWSKYYFTGAVTIHQNNAFNLSLTASIEQLKNMGSNYFQTPISESINGVHDSDLNYSYGLMGSYSVNPAWHFSGGIIHSPTINDANNTILYGDSHVALIGTTYSF